jgi:hypothetical protein
MGLVDGAAGGVGTEVGHLQDEGPVKGISDGNGLPVGRIDPLTGHIGLPHQQRWVFQTRNGTNRRLGMDGHDETPKRRRTAGAPSDTPERKRRTNTIFRIVAGEIGGGQRRAT